VTERGRPRTSHTKVAWGAAPRPTPRRTRGLPPRNPFHSSAAVGLCCRPPLAMEASKMLPMEPVAVAALIRALLWQLSRVFITADSQYGTSLSDSMALRCGWRSRQRGAVAAYTVAVLKCSLQLATWSWGRGSKGRISSSSFCRRGVAVSPYKWRRVLQHSSRRPGSCRGARSAAALCVRRLLPLRSMMHSLERCAPRLCEHR
jgi:hypothetical protein